MSRGRDMAFLAAIVAALTVAVCALFFFADMQSPTGRGGPNPLWPASSSASV
jgi:hypothetical protein